MRMLNLIPWTVLVLLLNARTHKAQSNPFYNNQDPQYHEQNPDYRRPNDQYNRHPPYNQDPYNRYNSSNFSNDPNDRYNRYNDPYNRDRNNSFNQDPNSRYNSNYSNDPNERNRYDDRNRYDPNDRNRYDPNDRNRYDPNDRNRYDPNDRNRYDPNDRNRYDPNNPYNRDRNNSNTFNQDPNRNYYNDRNRNNNTFQDPYQRDNNSRYNQDPYARNNQHDPFSRTNNPYDGRNEDQYNKYNSQNPNNNQNQRNQDPRYNQNPNDRYNNQNRQFDNVGGTQYGGQNDPNDNCCEEYCLQRDENPYLYFGTKTGYQVVYGKKYNNQLNIPDCNPVQIWTINRHGTSLPTNNEIQRLRELEKLKNEIILNYEDRQSYPYKGRLCSEDLNNLRRWRWNDSISERNEKSLTQQGIEDERYFAARLRSKFANLLNQPVSDQAYNFQYDQSNNNYKSNHDTYQAFVEGLFEKQAYMVHANTNGNAQTSPQGYCKTWREEVENSNHTYSEYERFKQRPEYKQLVRDVFRKLGFKFALDDSKIRDMYDICRYEKAWNIQEPSPWCAAFTKNQLLLLEYAEDLAEYYYSGYGNEVNARVGCSLVKDWYEMFQKTVNGDMSGYKVASYFTRSTEFLQFLTAMGIARDYPGLNADNYYQQNRRQWRTSMINPFGANLVAVLYHCQREKSYKVMFLNNEVPVNFPDCSVGLCDWFTVEEKYKRMIESCNRNYCQDGRSSSLVAQSSTLILLASIAFNFLFKN